VRATEFVESYFDAWNHSDAKGVADHLIQNGTYCDIPTNEQHSGEDLVVILTNFFASERNHYQLIGEVLSNEKTLAFEYKASPVDEGIDGWLGAEFMTLKDDGVIKIVDYYDQIHAVGGPANLVNNDAPKYAKSGLDTEQLERYLQRLKKLMEADKVYLESELTMPKLADLVNCSVNHLSQAVNSGFGMSFFDFLNSYRIEEAKVMLQHNDTRAQAILEVSFAVGFNSNSAFYAAFKKATGKTPAQFRRYCVGKN
jgi:AraC-like DNA-binding protein